MDTILIIKHFALATLVLLFCAFYIYKLNKIKANVNELSSNFTLALEAGNMSSWIYDFEKKLFISLYGPNLNGGMMTADEYDNFCHPDDINEIWKGIDLLLTGNEKRTTVSFRLKVNDQWRWYSCSMMLSLKKNNGVRRVIGTRHDITEEVHAKNEMELINQQLREKNEQIGRSEQNLRNILDNLPIPIYIKDAYSQTHVYHNQESEKAYGDKIGLRTPDLVFPDEALYHRANDIFVIESGQNYSDTETLRFIDGRVMETIVHKSTIDIFGKRHVLTARVDVTQQLETYRMSKIMNATLPALKAYTWVIDSRNTFFDSSINMQSFMINMSHRKQNRFIDFSLIHEEDKERIIEQFANFFNTEIEDDCAIFRYDAYRTGEFEWWESRVIKEKLQDKNGPYFELYGITYNVDERKKSMIELRQREQRLKELIRQNTLILNNSNSLLVYLNNDYVVQWTNSDAVLDGRLDNMFKQDTYCYSALGLNEPCAQCPVTKAIALRSASAAELQYNTCRLFSAVAIPVISDDDSIEGIVLKIDDVTEQRSLVHSLQEAIHKAEESDKLKSAFLANMSHEIRTPLNAIVGFSELLKDADDSQEKEEYMDIITTNNDMLLRLINDILDLSKIESGMMEIRKEIFDAIVLFKQEFMTMQNKCTNANVVIEADIPIEQCIVNLDRNRVAQVITNFATNAIKYTPSGTITMGINYEDGGLRVYVRDTGIGIDSEKHHLLFRRFEKLDSFAQGTGLGLSICKAIMDSVGGKIGFESNKNEGSLFWAWFPCIMLEPYLSSSQDIFLSRIDVTDHNSLNILVAEDIESNYILLKSILKGHNLTRACNGAQAVELFGQNNFDVIFMDVKMPVMDGLECTRRIRCINKEVPIIAITANTFESDREAAFMAGCNDFISKPIRKIQVTKSLERWGII